MMEKNQKYWVIREHKKMQFLIKYFLNLCILNFGSGNFLHIFISSRKQYDVASKSESMLRRKWYFCEKLESTINN